MYKFENSFLKLVVRKFLPACAMAIFAMVTVEVHAQTPPANDNFTNAQVIIGPAGTATGNTRNATVENTEPVPTVPDDPGTVPDSTIWYVWSAPFTGTVNFDTSGSTDPFGSALDTVIGAYALTNGNTLVEMASDDDDPNGDLTSRAVFAVTAGKTYYVQVGMFPGSTQGDVQLNWNRGPAAGLFQFTTSNFIMSENDQNTFPHPVPPLHKPNLNIHKAYIAITRVGGSAGRATLQVLMTPEIYKNKYITNTYGTNIFITNYTGTGIITFNPTTGLPNGGFDATKTTFTNYYNTNYVVSNVVQTVDQNGALTDLADIDYYIVNATNRNLKPPAVPLLVTNTHVCSAPDFAPLNFANPPSITVVNDSNVVVTVSNYFSTNITVVYDNPAAAQTRDYNTNDLPKTIIFDDFEMTRVLYLTNKVSDGPDWPDTNGYFLHRSVNRYVRLSMTNVMSDPFESTSIAPPVAGPDAHLVILDMEGHRQKKRGDNCVNYSVVNWEMRHFVTSEGAHDIVLNVLRTGDVDVNSINVSYTVSSRSTQGDFLGNNFELDSGSEYATPFQDFTPVSGTLNWGAGDPFPKTVTIPILADSKVEFNEDIDVDLYMTTAQAQSQPNVVIGYVDSCNITISYNDQPAGSLDTSFNPDNGSGSYPPFNTFPGANKPVRSVVVQPNGGTLIGGTFTAFDSLTNNRITRLLSSGLPDTSFSTGSGPNDFVATMVLDTSGRVVIGGGFTAVNGTNRSRVARLLSNGVLDTDFHPQFGANGDINAMALQPDGKILIGGNFTVFDNTNRARIARLNTDGTLDPTFDPGLGANQNVDAIAIQSTGNIIIGGEFTNVNGQAWAHLARLHPDGTLDTTFASGNGFDNTVLALSIPPSDKIYVAGAFKHANLLNRAGIVRLGTDGAVDLSFDPGTGADDAVYAVQAQTDSTVLIGGLFTSYDQTRRVGIARLLPEGMLDTSFMDTAYNHFAGLINRFYNTNAITTNADDFPAFSNTRNAVYALATDPVSGGVVIGGYFPRVGGGGSRTTVHPRNNVARLLGGSTPGPGNIIFGQTGFTVDENAGAKGLFVTLNRTNGNLGRANLSFDVNLYPAGPGAVVASDFLASDPLATVPQYDSVWDDWLVPYDNYGWQISDGYYGPNYRTIPTYLNPRSTSADVTLGIQDNTIVQQNRFADLSLFFPNGTDIFYLGGDNIPLGVALGRETAQLEIVDDDYHAGILGFSLTNYPIIENGGFVTVYVNRTNGSTGQVTVQYSTVNGTALAKTDYTKTSGVLTFQDGDTVQSFQVPIIDNKTAQPDRTFTVSLSSPTARATFDPSILPTNAVITIIDNDFGPGHLNFSSPTYSVLEGAGTATITVNRTGGNSGTLNVQCIATNGTATAGPDFTAVTTNLVWNNNDSASKTITVPILQDALVEGDETVNLYLTNALVGGVTNDQVLGSQSNAVLTILDDDFYGTPIFLSQNFNVMENAGAATITVVRSGGIAGTISVNYTTADGTAGTSSYTPTTGILTFGPNETSKSFNVGIKDNTDQDGNRFLNLTLYNPIPATNGFPKTSTLTIIDDESVHNPAGSVDITETANFSDYVHAVNLQPDGKILAGGDFTSVSTLPRKRVARLETDGTVDNTFQLNMSGANGSVRVITSQTPPTNFVNGSVMIAGDFNQVDGVNRSGVARLNLNGSIDETFDPGAGADGPVLALKEVFIGALHERRYMIGGTFANFNAHYLGGIGRINENGTVDTTFNAGLGITSDNAAVYALAIQADNKIVVGGDFTSFNGVTHRHLVRLNLDGSLDSTFNPDPGTGGAVRTICMQTDGKILVGGSFTTMNGSNYNHIARLNLDGSLDTTFNIGTGANDNVLVITNDTEGKILVGGQFTAFNDVTRRRLTRLNADGSIDPTINFGQGADNFIESIAVQTDTSIVIGGGFTSFDGIPAPHLARIAGGAIAGNGSIEFTSAFYGISENGTNATITLRRTGGTAGEVSAQVYTTDGTAVSGVDYIGFTNAVTFPVGETFKSFVIPVIDNIVVDGDRTVNLLMAKDTGGGASDLGLQTTATLTITNDDSAVGFSGSGYREAENVVGGNGRITLVRQGSLLGSITVTAETVLGGTAQPGIRYTPVTNTFTFAEGETNKTFLVPIINDTLIEGDQSVFMQLVDPIGCYLASPNQASLTIAEDDSGPGVLTFSATNYVVNEGTNILITILRTNGITGQVSVNLQTRDGTAIAGLDYLSTNVPVNFGNGDFIKTVLIQTIQDTLVEPTESLFLVLTNVGGGATIGGTNVAELDILDDDLNFSFGAPAYFVNEGGGTVTLSIFRNSGTNGTATVDYTTTNSLVTNGIAAEGLDYVKTSGTLTFAPTETFKTITVPILQDTLVEGSELFQVVLRNPSSGAQIGTPGVAAVTIVDDDTAFAFASLTNSVSEDATNAIITVNRINVNTGQVSVRFSTSDGTATANVDYIPTNGVLTFLDGEGSKTFSVPIIDDTLVEGDESIVLTLSAPSSNSIVLTTNTLLTIVDNDVGFRFASTDYRISESGVTAAISVLRNGATNQMATVDFATSNATATAGSDYVFTNGTLVFLPGETNKSFTVGIIDDSIIEGDETVLLNLSNPSTNSVLLSPNTASLTIVDNDGSLVVAAGSSLISESQSPANNTIDPGETVSLYFAFRSIGGGNTTNLVATLQATNGVTNPSGPQSYGVLVQNGPAVSRVFSFTANGTNTQSITAAFKLWDIAGSSSNFLGIATFTFNLGSITTSFTNLSAIVINDSQTPPTKASPYPSILNVAGVIGTLTKVKVSFSNYAHQFPDDVDVMLVGPANQKVLLMTDAGGGTSITNINLTFDDASTNVLPDNSQIFTSTNRPSNYKTGFLIGSVFPSVGPPADTNLAVFNGSNPNGAWSLYVVDDGASDSGVINGGWSMTLVTGSPVTPFADLAVTMTSAPAQATVSNQLVYTVTVTNYGPASASNIVLTDVLPPGVTYISNTLNGTPDTNNILTSVIPSLAKDTGLSFNIIISPNNVSVITNTITGAAAQTDADLTNNIARIVSSVLPDSSDLGVNISSSDNPILVAGTVTYTIVATNYGPSIALGTVVTNTLPTNMVVVSATTSLGTITTNATSVVFSLGDFSTFAGQNVATMTVTAKGRSSGTNDITAVIASSIVDSFKANNTRTVKTEVDAANLTYTPTVNGFTLTWSSKASSYSLQGATNLNTPINWITLVSPAPSLVGGVYTYSVTNSMTNNLNFHFFRLLSPAP